MITGIYIENFKGIGEPGIKLDLEPVTLLFGSNSAGKSTIFHAILLAYEVLVRGNRNPDKTELGGSIVDLGGFRRFVHLHHTTRIVQLRFEMDMSTISVDGQWPIDERLVEVKKPGSTAVTNFDISKIGEDVWSAAVEISLAWDDTTQQPYVLRYAVDLDGQPLAEIEDRREEGEPVRLCVEPWHPAFQWPDDQTTNTIGILDDLYPGLRTEVESMFVKGDPIDLDWLSGILNGVSDEAQQSVSEPYAIEVESIDIDEPGTELRRHPCHDESGRPFEAVLFRRVGESRIGVAAVIFPGVDEWPRQEAEEFVNDWPFDIGVAQEGVARESRYIFLKGQQDALPKWQSPLDLVFDATSEHEEGQPVDERFLSQLLSRLILVPGRTLAETLDVCRYIGPLREIPARQFVIPTTPDKSRWATGLAAWDYLNECPDETIQEISHWLADKSRIGTEHQIVRSREKIVPTDSFAIERLLSDDYLDEIERIRDQILSTSEVSRVEIYDERCEVHIDPHDCAIGIAQLVPIVVAGVLSRTETEPPQNRGMFLIEQPELHNHPSVEVGLGDLFSETIHQEHCRFILETHGEHLMLRMLRRIRQTTDKELPEGVNGLLPDEIAVYHVDRSEDGVCVKRLRIDETGEFLDDWPRGFFDERAEELFG